MENYAVLFLYICHPGAAEYTEIAGLTAAKSLDAAISANTLTAEETGWAKLLRYYLVTPSEDGSFADYPKAPAELEN